MHFHAASLNHSTYLRLPVAFGKPSGSIEKIHWMHGSLPHPPLVPVDEYLNSSYSPDREFVDGVLVERSVPTIAHSLLQILLGAYFLSLRKQFGFAVLSEVRTQIVERAHYRLADITLCPKPLPSSNVITVTPWIVIEILSPDDTMKALLLRFRDYSSVGVPHIVLLDPEDLIAYRFENNTLPQTRFSELQLPTGTVPFDTDALFAQLAEECKDVTE